MPTQQPVQTMIRANNLPVESTLALIEQPVLTVSEPTLAFTQTSTDKPGFQLLIIAQHQVDTPVTLTTDLPEHFQLASDSRPTFGPTLTLIPSAMGTYVHVRYFARNRGPHIGQLTIQAPYSSMTVALEGRTLGMLPAIRNVWGTTNQLPLSLPNQAPTGNRWAVVLAVAVMSGLAYVGYTYRNQFLSNIFQNNLLHPAVKQATKSLPSQSMADEAMSRNLVNTRIISSRKTSRKSLRATRSIPQLTQTIPADKSPDEQQTVVTGRTSRRVAAEQNTDSQAGTPARQQSIATPPADESELERVLNRPPGNQ